MDIQKLWSACKVGWSKETSYCEDYGDFIHSKSYGQCAVTSLLIGELLDVKYYRGVVKYGEIETSHYWVVDDEGRKIDLTWDQFPPYATLEQVEEVPRERLLPPENESINERYNLFKERVFQTDLLSNSSN